MDRISVFLSDWQVLFREGIHFTLSGEEDIDVIGEATSSEEALKAIEVNPPNVAVLNTDHEKFEGIRAASHLRRNFPSTYVMLIMDNDNDEQLYLAMKNGVSACLTKEVDPADLIDTIRAVARGEWPICDSLLRPEIASRVLDEFEEFGAIGEQVNNLLARLTPGETEILHNIANGATIEQVCQNLEITEESISQSFETIMKKLLSNDRDRQVIAAAQTGLPINIRSRLAGQSPENYVTKEEFNAFKETIRERLRAVIDEPR